MITWAQKVIRVPSDVVTIQGAIDAAQNGDTVLASPGTYFENINFRGKAITVTSSDGPAATIIDGSARDAVVTFNSGETRASVLSGMTIQNGYTPLNGGGISISGASPTIVANIIRNNRSVGGAGIWTYRGAPEVRENTITGGRQWGGTTGGGGGGIEIIGGLAGTLITGNIISDNALLGGASGGGIEIFGGGPITISKNIISGNAVYNDGGGISAINIFNLTIAQNVIANNTSQSGGAGGGIFLNGPAGGTAYVLNNTIYGNVGLSGWVGTASALYVTAYTTIQVTNNIMVAPPGQVAVACGYGNSPVFTNNDVVATSAAAWAGNCNYASGGNVSIDPLFVNPAALDFHLQPNSPAVDAGSNDVILPDATDFDGKPRFADGNVDCTKTIDLGAYELQAAPSISAYLTPKVLQFPPTLLGSLSAPMPVQVSNTKGCVGSLASAIAGDFTDSTTCGDTLPAGGACEFDVRFAPNSLGTRTGQLSVKYDEKELGPVALSGDTLDFALAVRRWGAGRGAGEAANFEVRLAVAGPFQSPVALSCGALPPGVSCVFEPAILDPTAGVNISKLQVKMDRGASQRRGTFGVIIIGAAYGGQRTATVTVTAK